MLKNRLTFGTSLVCVFVSIVIVLKYVCSTPMVTTYLWEHSEGETSLNITTMTEQANAPTRFLYLTQTENCIPKYLRSPEVIGDSEACQCDVLILSYRKECADTSLPHVQYIFNSTRSTTWTIGRNLLYEAAKKRKEKYIHYIFMDDDVQLEKVDKKSEQNTWRMYEESLKTFQPAVVIVLSEHNENIFPKDVLPERLNCEVTGYIQVYRMDAIFNAFHYQVIDHILPYTPKYDSVSWWYSQMYATIRCNIQFNGQVVIDPRIRTRNPQHRGYPRKHHNEHSLNNIVSDIRQEVPEIYQKAVEPIFQQWLTNRESKWLLGLRTCKGDLFAHPYKPYENLI